MGFVFGTIPGKRKTSLRKTYFRENPAFVKTFCSRWRAGFSFGQFRRRCIPVLKFPSYRGTQLSKKLWACRNAASLVPKRFHSENFLIPSDPAAKLPAGQTSSRRGTPVAPFDLCINARHHPLAARRHPHCLARAA